MFKPKVLTNYARYTDPNLDVTGESGSKGLTGNAYFTFTNGELTGLTANATTFHNKMALLANGGPAAVIEKNTARANLLQSLNIVALQVNIQANGDLLKLQSSGLPLASQPQHHQQPAPGNLKVVIGNNGDLLVSVDKSPESDNGTVFAYTPVSNTENDPNLWTLKPVNGHSATIKGLTAGIGFKISAAYKGNDNDDLVWAPPITKFASN